MKGLQLLTEYLSLQKTRIRQSLKQSKEYKEEDKEKSSWLARQIWISSAPLILTVNVGMVFGYSAILLPQLQTDRDDGMMLTEKDTSWIASIAALSMAAGSLLGGLLIERFGRKSTHMLMCPSMALGWLLVHFASSAALLLTGRFLSGLSCGVLGAATGVYIAETSEPKYRGFLLGAISSAMSLGLLSSHLLGTFLHWKLTALVCSSLPVVSLVILLFVPESPFWLAKKGKPSKAEHSFHWCRGYSEDAKNELTVLLNRQQTQQENRRVRDKLRQFSQPEFLKPLGIIVVYFVANQWSGVNAITFYSVSIMKVTVGEGVNEYLAMLIVDLIRVGMSVVACILLRNFCRRSLAAVSGVGTFLSLFVLSCSTHAAKLYPQNSLASYIAMTALVTYICFISIGFVPLPWALIGELFPLRHRSVGSGIASLMGFTATFSVVKTSPSMFEYLGASGTFLIYSVVALVGTVFIHVCLPETKGKTLHEIEDRFKKSKGTTETDDVNNNV